MLIYFLRHGETLWNREKRIQGGISEIDLTDFGVELAELTRDGMAKRGLKFDRIYTSPYRRAMHTAEIVMEKQQCPLIVDKRIREKSFGPYEGKQVGEGKWVDENIRMCFKNPVAYVAPEGAESFQQVFDRVRDFLENEIKPLEGKCENVLAVSHGGFMRALVCVIEKIPLSEYWCGKQPNCCVHTLKLENGKFSILKQSEIFYDPEIAAKVPSL